MIRIIKAMIVISALCTLLSACSDETKPPIQIAINPWPGYEFLYLAEQRGFFEQLDLNVRLIQLPSLADAQRAYVNGYADGLASTVIEAVQIQSRSDKDLKVVMVTDYSDGGDVIVANKGIKSIQELKGKRVGAEVTSLGIFILQRALAKHGLALSDVELVNVEQSKGRESMESKDIEAFVTYPPTSIDILNNTEAKVIFSSAEIPGEIIDTVSISREAIEANPMLVSKLRQAWQMALDDYEKDPHGAAAIMAKREGISVEDFQATLSDLQILDLKAQDKLFKDKSTLLESVKAVCRTLTHIQSIEENCENFPDILYQKTK